MPVSFGAVPRGHAAQSVTTTFWQLAHPWKALYVPGAHARHDPPFWPQYPVLHEQFWITFDQSTYAKNWGHVSCMPSVQ